MREDGIYKTCDRKLTTLANDADRIVKSYRKTCAMLKARLRQLEFDYILECESMQASQKNKQIA